MIVKLLTTLTNIYLRKKYNLDKSVRFGYPVHISGNIMIGKIPT